MLGSTVVFVCLMYCWGSLFCLMHCWGSLFCLMYCWGSLFAWCIAEDLCSLDVLLRIFVCLMYCWGSSFALMYCWGSLFCLMYCWGSLFTWCIAEDLCLLRIFVCLMYCWGHQTPPQPLPSHLHYSLFKIRWRSPSIFSPVSNWENMSNNHSFTPDHWAITKSSRPTHFCDFWFILSV